MNPNSNMITEQVFQRLLQDRLQDLWDRCRRIFREFGPNLRYQVLYVLTHAAERGKLIQVVGILEMHYDSHLRHQPWQYRGTVVNGGQINPTQEMFFMIIHDVLGIVHN